MESAGKMRGFTLFELIIYLALFSLLTACVVSAVVSVRKSVALSHRLVRESEEVSNFLMLKDLLEAATINKNYDIEVLTPDKKGRIALAAIDPFSKPVFYPSELPGKFGIRGCEAYGRKGFELIAKQEDDFVRLFSSCEGSVSFTPYYALSSHIKPSFAIFYHDDDRLCLQDDFGTYCFEKGTSLKLEALDKGGNSVEYSSDATYIALTLKPWGAIIACVSEE